MLRARDNDQRTDASHLSSAAATAPVWTAGVERPFRAAPRRIVVDPRFDAFRYGFYVLGLRRAFPRAELLYSLEPFLEAPADGLSLVLHGQAEHRVFLCADDHCTLDERRLQWCDVYGKVNLPTAGLPAGLSCRVVPLGPSFGVRVWPLLGAAWQAARTWMYGKPLGNAGREHFANYWRQRRYRVAEHVYRPAPATADYVFLVSSLWRKEAETNALRGRFMEAARALEGIRFEGGFAPRTNSDVPGFEHLGLPRRYSIDEYIRKTQASAVAFNTPAVHRCHGWKLGEFLALGKAIISTPLTRAVPAPLEHGRHVHYVDGSRDQIEHAISLICSDRDYRRSLEQAARQYYDDYLAPQRAIERLFDACFEPLTRPAR